MGMLLKNWGRVYSTARNSKEVEINLYPGELLRMSGNIGAEIVCHAGMLWITQEGDPRDYVLAAGDCFLIGSRGLVLIESLPADRRAVSLQGKRGWARFSLDTRVWQDD